MGASAWAAPSVYRAIGVPAVVASATPSVTVTVLTPSPITATSWPKDGSPVLFRVVNTGPVALADYGFWFDEEPLAAFAIDRTLTSLEVAGDSYTLANAFFVNPGIPAAAASSRKSVSIAIIGPTPWVASSDPNPGSSLLIQITNTGDVALDYYLLSVPYGAPLYGFDVYPTEATFELDGTTYPLSNPSFVNASVFDVRAFENTAGLAVNAVQFVAVRAQGWLNGGGYNASGVFGAALGDPAADQPVYELLGLSPTFQVSFVA